MANPRVRYEITAVDKSKAAINSAKSGIGGLGKAFGALGALAATAGITSFVSSTLKSVDNIAKLSTQLGISTEALSTYQFVADQTGVSFRTLTTGLQRMTRRVAEAATGSGPAKDALEELGLSAEKLNNLSPDEQFKKMADALNEVGNSNDRVRLAFKLFDSDGVKLLRTTKLGSEGLDEMSESFKAMGGQIDGNTAKSVEDFNDTVNRLGNQFGAIGLKIFNSVLPSLQKFASFIEDNFESLVAIVETLGTAFSAVGSVINVVLSGVIGTINFVARALTGLLELLGIVDARAGNIGIQPNGIQARATGGPVTAGKPFLVGERGPELFVPNTNGNIVPNFNQSIAVNVNSTTGNLAILQDAIKQAARAGYNLVAQDMRTNGPIRQALPV